MSGTIDGALAPDLYDYDFENDPIATLDRLRAEDPVHWSRHGFWYLTRYEDCAAVLKDPARFSSMAAGWGGENPLAQARTAGAQSGAEKAYCHALVGNAGANLIYESAGMHASLLGYSFESVIIDNDIIGATQRTIRGIDVDEASLSFDTIRQVCLEGPGHFLGSDQTLRLMQSAYLYPAIGDRKSPNEWTEQGALDITERAEKKVREILSTHFPTHIGDQVDARIRDRFPVKLPRAAMLAAAK